MRALVTAVVGYLLAWAVVTFLYLDWSNAAAERGRHVAALGEEHAQRLAPPPELLPLTVACEGRLPPAGPTGIAGYVASTTAKPSDENLWDELVVGIAPSVSPEVQRQSARNYLPLDAQTVLSATWDPTRWQAALLRAKSGLPDLTLTRYLVVAKYFTLQLPISEGVDGYTRGAGTYAARVIALRDGEVLCEGRGEVKMKEAVHASGRGDSAASAQAQAQQNAAKLVPYAFSLSVTLSPLHAVCAAGGELLCARTGQWVGR